MAITPRSRWLILNSPNNPTGAVYTAGELEGLMKVVRGWPNLWVMSDDIYEHLCFDGRKFVTALQVAADLRERIVTINGTSKSYAMTGWRIGYAAGPRTLIAAMTLLQGHTTTHAAAVSQAAAVAAMTGPQDFVQRHGLALARGRQLMVDGLRQIEGFDCHEPEGAFYVYLGVAGLIGRADRNGTRLTADVDVAEFLLAKAGVVTVPGTAFGDPGHLRLCFARPESVIVDAVRRIGAAVRELRI